MGFKKNKSNLKTLRWMGEPYKNMIKMYPQIDLGLPSGVQWATCNVGASSPEDYGTHFAWGELYPSEVYTEANCETSGVEDIADFSGDWDYDIATADWGDGWRMPTREECEELVKECTWEWITQNGVNGCKVTGPNGNSIFLPTTGYRDGSSLHRKDEIGFYWSSTPRDDGDRAYYFYFDNINHSVDFFYPRFNGRCVRPVTNCRYYPQFGAWF